MDLQRRDGRPEAQSGSRHADHVEQEGEIGNWLP